MNGWDAKVIRVDQPEPGLLCLSLRAERRTETLLLVTLPGTLALGIVEHRPRGADATETTSKLRRHLEGTRILEPEESRRAARLRLERRGETLFLVATAAKPYGHWWLLDAASSVVVRSPGASAAPPDEEGHWTVRSAQSQRDSGRSALDAHQEARLRQLRRALGRQVKRIRKKRAAIVADLARAEDAERLHEQASLLLAHAARVPADAESIELESWETPGRRVRIELRPGQSAAERAQVLFAKAKRLKRGLDVAPSRLASVDAELDALCRIADEWKGQTASEAAATLEARGIRVVEPRERERQRRRSGPRLPYREFVSLDGTSVLVGRGAGDNDRLTLRVARPHDLWLHARGVTGAHVVVRLDKGRSCSPETLVDAATLGAHFSDLRGEPVVDVLYTPRRFVRKSKGSPIGSVTLEREKVIAVRVEPRRLERLLEGEKRA